MLGDNINIIKTTFELNLDFYQAFKQYGYTKIWKQREAVNKKGFSLITCKLAIQKSLLTIRTKKSRVHSLICYLFVGLYILVRFLAFVVPCRPYLAYFYA